MALNGHFPKIVMHVGAHKTATTHLQRSIQQVRQPLVAKGVQFHGPNRLRGQGRSLIRRFGLPILPTAERSPQEVTQALADMTRGCDRLVLSEENFIGGLQSNWGRIPMPIYPEAADRLTMLADRIAPKGIDVFLAIRGPAAFMTSSFGQALLSGKQVPLKNYKAKNPLNSIDWAGLIHRLLASRGVASVTVWQHENYDAVFARIMTAMLGETAAKLVTPLPDKVHRGLSAAAVDTLLKVPVISEELASEVRAAMPVGPEFAPFDAFTAEEKALSDQFYADQLWQIKQLPQITFLHP